MKNCGEGNHTILPGGRCKTCGFDSWPQKPSWPERQSRQTVKDAMCDHFRVAMMNAPSDLSGQEHLEACTVALLEVAAELMAAAPPELHEHLIGQGVDHLRRCVGEYRDINWQLRQAVPPRQDGETT